MTKIDIISGFLGAGKTTLIKKLIKEVYKAEKLVLIENEFGEIGVDGGFLNDSGVEIKEMNSGCICCSLQGDFKIAMSEVIDKFSPDRIVIEPSGVGKLSDVVSAVNSLSKEMAQIGNCITVADLKKVKLYSRNFGEFYNNQIEHAGLILLSRTKDADSAMINNAIEILRGLNENAAIVTTPWDILTADDFTRAMFDSKNRIDSIFENIDETEHCHHEHEHEHCHHDHEHEHEHEHCHHDHEHKHEHEHCHHDHEHEHEHEHCHHDHEHEHHHADDVFDTVAFEAAMRIEKSALERFLKELFNEKYGVILRAKGIVEASDSKWLHFDMVPEELEIRDGRASYTGILCIIGTDLNKTAIKELVNKEFNIG